MRNHKFVKILYAINIKVYNYIHSFRRRGRNLYILNGHAEDVDQIMIINVMKEINSKICM